MSATAYAPRRELPRLPPELIARIIFLSLPPAHVATPLQPRYDLLSTLCLVNRTWRALAQPHFFTHVEYDRTNNRLTRLAEAVAVSDELAALARGTKVVRLKARRPEVFGLVIELHPRLGTLWLDGLRSPSVSDLVPLKDLKFLHFGQGSYPFLSLDVPTPLPSIEHLSLTTLSGDDLEQLVRSPMTTFPNLHTLTLLGQQYIPASFPSLPTPLTSAIKTLVLMTDTRESSQVARKHLSLFPKLESLHLGYWIAKIPFPVRVASLATPRLGSLTLEWNCAEDHEVVEGLDMAELRKLKYLKLNYYEGDYGVSQGSEAVREACRERGVELVEKWWTEEEKAEKGSHYWVNSN